MLAFGLGLRWLDFAGRGGSDGGCDLSSCRDLGVLCLGSGSLTWVFEAGLVWVGWWVPV